MADHDSFSPAKASTMKLSWKALVPIAVAIAIAIIPAPAGLAPHAWYYFAIFAGVIIGLMLEPLPGGAIGLIGVTVVAVLSPWVLFAPAELAKPGFKSFNAALTWALSGFSNTTVWLIFGAFMFALGYEKTGLGKRIALLLVKKMGKRTLTLGYAVMIADTLLAPFTPSNTARSGGTIFPVIRNLPALYDSKPNDTSRKIGSYLMWTALAATCVTSSMFLTALAPNLLAIELVKKTAQIDISWGQWFVGFLPVGVVLIAALPFIIYKLYPPEIKSGTEVPAWAAQESGKMGPLSRNELIMGALVILALALWIFGSAFIDPTTVALVVISLMVLTGVVQWNDITGNKAAWNVLVWFATLVTLAGGLSTVGFISWFAESASKALTGLSPMLVMILLVVLFFLIHYMFASVTAHVTAILPVFLAAGMAVPGLPVNIYALLLCFTLGIMGIITPYATGPSPVYFGSGYVSRK